MRAEVRGVREDCTAIDRTKELFREHWAGWLATPIRTKDGQLLEIPSYREWQERRVCMN